MNNITESDSKPHQWQVGDLIRLGNKGERKLIVSVSDTYFEVIAESGWYNRYPIPINLPLQLVGQTQLDYTLRGRNQLFQDFLSGSFTRYFKP